MGRGAVPGGLAEAGLQPEAAKLARPALGHVAGDALPGAAPRGGCPLSVARPVPCSPRGLRPSASLPPSASLEGPLAGGVGEQWLVSECGPQESRRARRFRPAAPAIGGCDPALGLSARGPLLFCRGRLPRLRSRLATPAGARSSVLGLLGRLGHLGRTGRLISCAPHGRAAPTWRARLCGPPAHRLSGGELGGATKCQLDLRCKQNLTELEEA